MEEKSCMSCKHLEKCNRKYSNEYIDNCSPIIDNIKFAKYEKADELMLKKREEKARKRSKLERKFELEMALFTLLLLYNILYPIVLVGYTVYFAIANPYLGFGDVILNSLSKMWLLILLDIIIRFWIKSEIHNDK